MTSTRRFSSGGQAMAFLTGKKTPAQLDAEIDAELAGKRPVLSPSSARPLPPRPPRTVASPRARPASRAKPASRATSSPARFFESLPPAHTRRGQRSVNTSVIAKTIRNEVAAAANAGVLPAGTKVSATTDHNSIRVSVSAWQGAVFSPTYQEHLMDPSKPWDPERRYREAGELRSVDPRLSGPLNKALEIITRLAGRHNYDDSDLQADHFDVGYYLHVDARPVESEAEAGIRLESDKPFAQLMERARVAADAIGPAATKSICGKRGLAGASKHCLERILKIAERAAGRLVEYDKRRRGWFPV